MAWTAKLREAKRANGKWDVAIIYTDGVNTIVRGYQLDSVNETVIRATVRAEVARMTAVELEAPPLVDGTDIGLTEPAAPPPPTAAELAREEWFADYHKLQQFCRLIDLDLISATDTRVVALQTKLKTAWLNSYMDGI